MSTLNGNHDYVGDKPSPKPVRVEPSVAFKVLKTLASLRVTIVLFSLSMVLVFFGTVAMMQYSIEDTMKHYFRSWYTFIEFRTISDFGSVFFPYLFDRKHPLPGKLPFPGGYIIGWAMFINLLAAHAIRFKLTWKRSGIFMLHAGVIVLLAGEFLTGEFAVETRMMIKEGESSRYVFHLSKYELAFIDTSNPDSDEVVVVPSQLILDKGTANWASHPDLPVDVQLVEFFPNARLRNLKPGEEPVATKGMGLAAAVESRPRVKGTDSTGEIDSPAIYVSFRDKAGNALGTYLFSTTLERNQEITVDGKKYRVSYRFKREYRPYELHLDSAKHDVYDRTDTPKNYESVVRVLDPQSGEYGPVRIWMNNPMYYKGETFYQSGMFTDEETGVKTTTLQVVVNHAWTFPYFACFMVAAGMAFHFSLRLITFLNNRTSLAAKAKMAQPARASVTEVPGTSNRKRLVAKYFPAAIVVLSAFMLVGRCFPPSPTEGKFDYYGFGRIPVQHGGRVQPLDSLARNSLMVISGKQEYVDSTKSDRKYSAIEWLLAVWSKQDEADKFRIFRVEHLELLGLLNLPQRPGSFRYSFAEIDQKLPELENKASDAMSKPKEQRSLFEEKVLELTKHIELYRSIQFRKNPGLIPTDPYGGKWMSYGDVIEKEAPAFFFAAEQKVRQDIAAELHADPGVMSDLVRKHLGGMDRVEQAMKEAGGRDELLRMIIEAEVKLRKASLARENFLKMLPEKYPAISDFDKILANYKDSKPDDFNSSVATYHEKHTTAIPDSVLARERLEARMNYFDPFLYCYVLYIGVFLLAAFSWLVWNQPLRKAAFWLACLTLVVHTGGLVARMYIGNRPPVTNLYSAAIFIGWGSLVMCLILEPIYKLGISTFVGGLFGLCTMVVARFLAESGDTLEMLQAVLDTNFWLATHVTCVTTGYYATGFAGLLCTVYLVGGVFTPAMRGTVGKMLGSMMYGTICFATLMSFIGTVLGGIWADQSWGRFWGWDPKENGAVLIVIWNALILHARWGGLIKSRGIAVLGVIGINWMVWSWFGTNQLGIGLHAYGFDNTLVLLCVLTWLGASLIAALGMVPLKYWASFARRQGMLSHSLASVSRHVMLEEYLGEKVVIDLKSPFVCLGTLTRFDDHFLELNSADLHDLRDTDTSRENYVAASVRTGIKCNRKKVVLFRADVVAISRLGDVSDL